MSKGCNCGGPCCTVKEITINNPTTTKNKPEYKFYIYSFDNKKILGGYETKNDARYEAAGLSLDLGELGIYSKHYLINILKLDPDKDRYWQNINESEEEPSLNIGHREKSNISISPINTSLDNMIEALSNINNYGEFISNLRNTKVGLEKALEAHFGPSHFRSRETLEKQRGEKFPLKTKQSIDDFIKGFTSKPNVLIYDINDEENEITFPADKNPNKEMTKKIIATVMGKAGIKYNINDKKSLSEILLKHIAFKKLVREGIKNIIEKERIPGGLAKGKKLEDIAKHHNCKKDELQKQLDKGIEVEKEHTTSKDIAEEIAMDHLWEDPKYYNKLSKIEESMFKIEPELLWKIYDILVKEIPEIKNKFPLKSHFYTYINGKL